MVRAFLFCVVLTLAFSQGAEAVTLVWPDGTTAQPFQRWVERAYVPTPQGAVNVRTDICPSTGTGCYEPPPTRAIHYTSNMDRLDFLHELGHDFDFTVLTNPDREAFMRVMRVTGPWWNGNYHDLERGPVSPAEQFADGYALCLSRRHGERYIAHWHEYDPTPRQFVRVCALIRHAGGWYMRRATSAR